MSAAATVSEEDLHAAIGDFINILVAYIDTSDLTEERLAAHVDFMARWVELEAGVDRDRWFDRVLKGLDHARAVHAECDRTERKASRASANVAMAIAATKRARAEGGVR